MAGHGGDSGFVRSGLVMPSTLTSSHRCLSLISSWLKQAGVRHASTGGGIVGMQKKRPETGERTADPGQGPGLPDLPSQLRDGENLGLSFSVSLLELPQKLSQRAQVTACRYSVMLAW